MVCDCVETEVEKALLTKEDDGPCLVIFIRNDEIELIAIPVDTFYITAGTLNPVKVILLLIAAY